MNSTNEALFHFINASPSPFHAVSTLAKELTDKGYTPLSESDVWHLEKGGRYFVTRAGTTIAAFTIPSTDCPTCFMISAAHSDAPCLKLKEKPELGGGAYTRISIEGYGGMILSTWLDRPLSIAGRVIIKTDNGILSRLIHFDRDLCMIPNVAIHMNRSLNSGYNYNLNVDMVPLFGNGDAKGKLAEMIAEAADCKPEDIVGSDLFLYHRGTPIVWGANEEYLSAPRLDDLQCAFGTMQGLMQAENNRAIAVCAVFDNEEIGSATKQGAGSTFLSDLLIRICEGLGLNESDYRRMLASGMMVSADNAHAVHPNHPEYADSNHRPLMNAGIVIKHSAAMRYTTDGVASSLFSQICARAGVKVQHFANRADLAGGSTLGSISNTRVSLCTVDIGLPQLAMHSSFETAGTEDTEALIKAMKEFFSLSLLQTTDGNWEILA